MCELFGMSFNLKIRANISFRGFRQRGIRNPDGWGLAFYPDESAQVFKEAKRATDSPLSKFIQEYKGVKSKIFVGHVRITSRGKIAHKNTHPFLREMNGKEYVFAHNGTLQNYEQLELGRFRPVGDTDSEYIFCHLLHSIERRGVDKWTRSDFEWLANKMSEINEYGRFNAIFSDGEYLFCYHDINGYNGLHFIHRVPPYGPIKLIDEHWNINLAEEKDEAQRGYIIATRELTDEKWVRFSPSELIVFKDGRIVYSNRSRNEVD